LTNVTLSLADHAQNGVCYASEWIPVVAVSALAIGVLLLPFILQLELSRDE
jgi:hypothetical protein